MLTHMEQAAPMEQQTPLSPSNTDPLQQATLGDPNDTNQLLQQTPNPADTNQPLQQTPNPADINQPLQQATSIAPAATGSPTARNGRLRNTTGAGTNSNSSQRITTNAEGTSSYPPRRIGPIYTSSGTPYINPAIRPISTPTGCPGADGRSFYNHPSTLPTSSQSTLEPHQVLTTGGDSYAAAIHAADAVANGVSAFAAQLAISVGESNPTAEGAAAAVQVAFATVNALKSSLRIFYSAPVATATAPAHATAIPASNLPPPFPATNIAAPILPPLCGLSNPFPNPATSTGAHTHPPPGFSNPATNTAAPILPPLCGLSNPFPNPTTTATNLPLPFGFPNAESGSSLRSNGTNE